MWLKGDLKLMKDNAMRNEQYTRRNNNKTYGLAANRGESCLDTVGNTGEGQNKDRDHTRTDSHGTLHLWKTRET
jgi:hypothetical protein